MRTILVLAAAMFAAGCSSSTSGAGDCSSNDGCGPGEICSSGACERLCTTDTQCTSGTICRASVCVPGARSAPAITAVDGDSLSVCPDGNGTHCIEMGIIVNGDNLEGAAFLLEGPATSATLSLDPASDVAQPRLWLPDVGPGAYVLSATNQSGADQMNLTLLQGPPGADFSPTDDQVLMMLNGASGTIDAARLPVGTGSTQVARGDHTHVHSHSEYLQATGGMITGDIATTGSFDATVDITAGGVVGAGGNITAGGDIVAGGRVEGLPGDEMVWTMMHATAAGACAAVAPVGGSCCDRVVVPRHSPQSCTWTCANETNDRGLCLTGVAVGSFHRGRITSYGTPAASFFNYGCGDTQNAYDEINNEGLNTSYTQYCCCYK